VEEIEEHIATNRIPGTYGGYMMGNPNMKLEDIERAPKSETTYEYYVTSAIDPGLWAENFRDYVGREYDWSRQEELQFSLKLDLVRHSSNTIDKGMAQDARWPLGAAPDPGLRAGI